jgi:CRISPR/Cas system-associated exonuclease Cas4 (RecB family)
MKFVIEAAPFIEIDDAFLWPDRPSLMSFSLLGDLEACPKRWALKAASYPKLWEHRGYPGPLMQATIEGQLIHSSIELTIKEMTRMGCPNLNCSRAVSVLRELGGITAVIKKSLDQIFDSYQHNPRVAHRLGELYWQLLNRTAEARSVIQQHLARIRLVPSETSNECHIPGSILLNGCHAEVELKALEIAWHGKADLITLSRESCEIRDFKTGAAKDRHFLQLQTYALLWQLDNELNPSGRQIDRLVLSYNNREVFVPVPGLKELVAIKSELLERTKSALRSIDLMPPASHPSKDNCPFCMVRHLCDDYWYLQHGPSTTGYPQDQNCSDFQIRLIEQQGPSSWVVEIERSTLFPSRTVAIFQMKSHPKQRCESETRLRVLNAFIDMPKSVEGGTAVKKPIITLAGPSEAFILVRNPTKTLP